MFKNTIEKKQKKEKQPDEKTNSKYSPSEKNRIPEKKKPFASTIFQTKSASNLPNFQAPVNKGTVASHHPIQNRTSQLYLQKIKFRVSSGAVKTASKDKAEKQALTAPELALCANASISANCKNNNLFYSATAAENNQNALAKEPILSNPVFATSPFVTFSTLHAKNLQTSANQSNVKLSKNSLINQKDTKNGYSSVSKQASTNVSSPTNLDCSSSLDKSVYSCNQSLSNQMTSDLTFNSLKFHSGEAAAIAECLHFKEKTNNNFTSNFLINGNSKCIKSLHDCASAVNNKIGKEKTDKTNKEDEYAGLNGVKELKGNFEQKGNYQTQFAFCDNLASASQENFEKNGNSNYNFNNQNQSQTTTICLNLSNLSSLNLSNSLKSFSSTLFNNSNTNNNFGETHTRKKLGKKLKELKVKHKRLSKEGSYNCGRWQPEEHQRFIVAIMKYGNEWKQVQKHVGTRSSTQARSHAQKFFVKIKKSNVFHFNVDLSKNSIKTLHEMANSLNTDEYFNAIKALNCVAFERKAGNAANAASQNLQANAARRNSGSQGSGNNNGQKRKVKKEEVRNVIDLNNFYFSDLNGNFNIM